MSGIFPTFSQPQGFPQPAAAYQAPAAGVGKPTNAWFQNAVKGTVPPYTAGQWTPFPDAARDVKPTPWIIRGQYNSGKFLFGHSIISPLTHTTEFGNNGVSQTVGDFINEFQLGTNLKLAVASGGYLRFDTDEGNSLHTSQGAPNISISIASSLNPTIFNFLFASSNLFTLGATATGTLVSLPFNRTEVTRSFSTLANGSGTLLIYDRYTRLNNILRLDNFTFSGNDPTTGTVTYGLVVVGTFTGGVFTPSAPGVSYDSLTRVLTLNPNTNVTFISSVVYAAAYTSVTPYTIRFYSYDAQSITITATVPNQLTLTLPPGVTSCGIDILPVALPKQAFITGLATGLIPALGQPGMSYSKWTTASSTVSFYLPVAYAAQFLFAGATVTPTTEEFYDVAYGTMRLYTANALEVILDPLNHTLPPPLPTLTYPDPTVAAVLATAMGESLTYDFDAVYRNFDLTDDKKYVAYLFGQHAAKYARLLHFANNLGIMTAANINVFRNVMTSWMTSSNGCFGGPPDSNQLQYESVWGGVMTPADYYVETSVPDVQANFGNSFYNDHHFHWGYLLYASYILCTLDPTWGVTYKPQLKALLLDYLNPTAGGETTTTRHKNWFFGHSYATGVVNSVDIDQESVSEAINAYYAGYLIADYFSASDASFTPIKLNAEAALVTEIAAAKAYWTDQSDPMRNTLLTPSTTILKQTSRTYAAFAAGAPTSYPSNSLYRYSIISLPWTEISPRYLVPAWAQQTMTDTQDWLRVDRQVLFSLTNYERLNPAAWSYTPHPSPYDTDTSTTPANTTAWGLFYMGLLASLQLFPTAGTSTDLNKQFEKVRNRAYYFLADTIPDNPEVPIDQNIVRLFDSLSNNFYLLYYVGGYYRIKPQSTTPVQSTLLEAAAPVEVPTITITVEPTDNGLDVASVVFVVKDVVSYKDGKPYNPKLNCAPRETSCPKTTTFSLTGNAASILPVINSDKDTLVGKCDDLNVSTQYLIQYAYTKLILARLLFGDFNLVYLQRSFDTEFFTALSQSRFNKFREYFTSLSLVDNTGMIYTVVGYGNVPQQGEYLFR